MPNQSKTAIALALAVALALGFAGFATARDGEASVLNAQTDTRKITGVVKDAEGQPLLGAAVMVPGTQSGSVTDNDGKFTLDVSSSVKVLEVSCLGFKTQALNLTSSSDYSVSLVSDNELLNELVVVGYAVQKKVNLSGSVSSVDVSELTESRPVSNISQVLGGVAAGVQVTSSNNKPGDDNASILVRGQGTLNTSSPLIIIDGMEAAINSVNPQDIENISILKDAASSAIYGSRAANGVVLITTKSGKGGSVKLDYNGYVSAESMRFSDSLASVTDYADYMEIMNEAYANSNLAPLFTQGKIDEWRAADDPLRYPNSDWQKEIFRTALSQNHNLSISGGSDKVRFYTSFGYLDNPGVMEVSGEKKYSARLNLDANVRPWLKLGVNANGSHAVRELGTDKISNVFTYVAAATPGMAYRAPDGRYGSIQNTEDDPQANSVLRDLNSLDGQYTVNQVRSRFYGTLTPVKGLDITASYSFMMTDTQKDQKPIWLASWNFQTNTITNSHIGKSYVNNSDAKTYRYFGDVTARYNSLFFDDRLDFSILAGASQEQYLYNTFSAQRYDLVDMSLFALNAATGESSTSGYGTSWAMRSFFSRLNLSWQSKYLLELNLRADGSSRFAKDKRWGYFPSASAAWRLSEEGFMAGLRGWLDNLKVRLSYGGLGNNSIGNYQSQALFSPGSNYSWGNNMVTGMAQGALANSAVTWETTYVTNLGVDFAMLENRLTGTIDVFNKRTEDILITLPAPAVHGTATVPTQNAAIVSNKGVELTLGWRDSIRDFSYSVSGNVSYIKNNVDKFKGEEYSLSGVNMIKEGLPINSKYMLQVDRIIQTDEDLQIVNSMLEADPKAFASYGVPQKGDFLYKDINNDGVINSSDRDIVYEGGSPKLIFGLNLNLAWKGLDLYVLMQGMAGYKTYYLQDGINTPTARWGYQLNKDVVEGRWYEGRTDATYPRLLMYSDTRNTIASDFYLSDNSFLKVKNIQLGYTLPSNWVKKLTAERVRIYGSLENFFTFTKFRGFDPEVSGLAYPTMKQASIGLNVTF